MKFQIQGKRGNTGEYNIEAYSESCQTSKIERFTKTVYGFKPLIIFLKRSILDVS